MGTDIHCATEVWKKGKRYWEVVRWPNPWYKKYSGEEPSTPDMHLNRNYDLFAIFGNVRNGTGFAGCDTGDGFKFISDGRGLPEDISGEAREVADVDHSHSHFSMQEFLDFDWDQTTKKRGWINGKDFEKWDRMKDYDPGPESYCGGVSGPTIEHITAKEMLARLSRVKNAAPGFYQGELETFVERNKNTYALAEWEVTHAYAAQRFWWEWAPRLLRLGDPGNTRLVFSFDS